MGVHTNVQEAEMAGAHSKRGNDEAAEESIGAHLMGDLIHPPWSSLGEGGSSVGDANTSDMVNRS